MRCARCRTVIKKAEEYEYKCKCENCGRYRKSCKNCKNDKVENCLKCLLENQEKKLDLFFGETNPGSYVEKCDKVKEYGYYKETSNIEELCWNLIIDTKLGLLDCVRTDLQNDTEPDELREALFKHHLNEGEAIFWLAITTTGTFHESGLIPKINESIELSNHLEGHFRVNENFRARINKGEPLNKEQWLNGTIKYHEAKIKNDPQGMEAVKGVLSSCKILHYFVIQKKQSPQSFPDTNTDALLATVETLLKAVKIPGNLNFKDDFISPIDLYLESIKNEMKNGGGKN